MDDLALPLMFQPVYQTVVWGGRRMSAWRHDLPAGPVGESWDLADHPRGMSVVSSGTLTGQTLRQLTERFGKSLVGGSYAGGDFPLMVKLIDANDRLSIQVHPDDALARSLGVGERGKTECWLMIENGGELYVGTRPGTTRETFERALSQGLVAEQLNRFQAKDGDFFFLAARTVHALGTGCLLYEIQQTCDVTFRVDDWGRVGLDGKPRPLHIAESLSTIDFTAKSLGPAVASEAAHPAGGSIRRLAQCEYFLVEERHAQHTGGGGQGACAIVVCLGGSGTLATAAGRVALMPMRTYLVPASAGPWTATADRLSALRLLVAQPT
ncbi:MAG: class I mannose-6-phosphate isomerase [Planctomycetes bacterium]|nr:class I mannose-6-phosphate isomerase [Planctomycetota bacterium]